jgi:hypothetical protein
MTSRMTTRRLAQIATTIATTPIPVRVARNTFARFLVTGELPEDDRLACAVIQRVALGYDVPADHDPRFDPPDVQAARHAIPTRQSDEVMDSLLLEAVSAHPVVRHAARLVLRRLAELGLDVTSTPFHGHDVDLPTHGSVGAHLLGLDKRLFRGPSERHALRLQQRLDTLCERLDASPGKLAEACRAAEKLQRSGDLPNDDLVLDTVLALGEMSTLTQHALGVDVSQEMACFDAITRAKTAGDRSAGIERLQKMAIAGLLC